MGEPLESVSKSPKVKLEISCAPGPPVLNYEPLPYCRRKRRKNLAPGETYKTKFVKLVTSSKRIHPGTKSNNILLEPLTELQDNTDNNEHPKYRRRKARVPSEDVPITMAPTTSILDTFDMENYPDDNDYGFTTIKDLADRGITKMEPLDYDQSYEGYYNDENYDYVDNDNFYNEDDTMKDKSYGEEDSINMRIKEEPVDYNEEAPLKPVKEKKKKA